jgi:hypothetical protein
MWCCSDIVALSIDGVAATLSLCQVLCLGMWLARPYQGHLHRSQHYRLVVIPSDSVACMIALLHTWLVAASRAFAFTVWCWGLVLGCGVGVWCWGLVLGSGVLRLHEAGRLHRPVWLAGTEDAVGVMFGGSEACRA